MGHGILIDFALVFAVIAAFLGPIAFPVWPTGRLHFGWLALAFLIASMIFRL